ncbi:MAG: hypothetical protein WCS77_08045 [Elusimicrobiaceae bacterium]
MSRTRKTQLFCLFSLLLCGSALRAERFVSSDGNLAFDLPSGWRKSAARELKESTIELTGGQARLAAYPVFSLTPGRSLTAQLEADRTLVLNNLQRPSGFKQLSGKNCEYFYFSWQGFSGLNAMGYLNCGGKLFHAVISSAKDFKELSGLVYAARLTARKADPDFSPYKIVTAGPKNSPVTFDINTGEYPKIEASEKALRLTRFDNAEMQIGESEMPLDKFDKHCEDFGRMARLANKWRFCCSSASAKTDCFFTDETRVYYAGAVNVPSERIAVLLASAKVTSIINKNTQNAEPYANLSTKLPLQGNPEERPLSSLPPLAARGMGTPIKLLLGILGLALGTLLLRMLLPEPDNAPFSLDPQSPYPLTIVRKYFSPDLVEEITDSRGTVFTSRSSRKTELIAGMFLLLFIFCALAAILLPLAGLEGARFAGYSALALQLAVLFMLAAALIPKQLFLYNNSQLVAYAVMAPVFAFQKTFTVFTSEGKPVAVIRRPLFRLRRRWIIAGPDGADRLEMYEDLVIKSLLRRVFGQLWGLLRTDYVISDGEAPCGILRQNWALSSSRTLFIGDEPEIDYRVVLLMGLLASRVDPDRWYPWIS